MNQNRCALCNEIVPSGVGVYLNDKIYCNQRHAEKHFIGTTYCESKEYYGVNK